MNRDTKSRKIKKPNINPKIKITCYIPGHYRYHNRWQARDGLAKR